MASAGIPASRNAWTEVAPWRLESRLRSGPRIIDTCAISGFASGGPPGPRPGVGAPPRLAKGLLAPLGGPPLALQELGRAVAVVGAARGAQSLGVLTVDFEPLGLPVARRRRPLVPVEAEPLEGLEDRGEVLVGRAGTVGVLDPKDEGPAVVARVEPVEQRGARAADVEVSRRARREAHTDGVDHVRTALNGAQTTSGSRPDFSRRHSTSTSGGAPPLHPDTPHRSPAAASPSARMRRLRRPNRAPIDVRAPAPRAQPSE